jgi:hypothetical protein
MESEWKAAALVKSEMASYLHDTVDDDPVRARRFVDGSGYRQRYPGP